MKEIDEFFRNLFRYDLWPPRWKCGYWSDFHGYLYIASELMVWVAYFLIPLFIVNYFYKKRATIRFRKVYILFASFILLCGSTHFIDALMFWIPMYRFNAVVRLATGIVSLFTVYHLVKVLPELFKQQTNLELEREIMRRKEVEYQLAQANHNLGAFAYVASHDLQEPLRKIKTFTTLLYDRNKERLDEGGKRYAEKIISSAGRMQNLVTNVLTLSTITGQAELNEVDTNAIVKRAIEDLDLKIREKGAVVTLELLPKVMGNESYLAQLFINLISNAIKFSDKKPVVMISGELRDKKAVIRVSDNGIGIKQENLSRIFEAFHRLHGGSEYEGTGIGLAIVRKIVEVHGGSIRVESAEGEGTTFFIDLTGIEG